VELRTKQHFRRAQTAVATKVIKQSKVKIKSAKAKYRSSAARTSSVFHRKTPVLPAHAVVSNYAYLGLRTVRFKRGAAKRRILKRKRKTWTRFPRCLVHSALNTRGNLFSRKTIRRKMLNSRPYFFSEARWHFMSTQDLTRAVGLYNRFYRQAPFEFHRARL
jgi:hypothetical protein